MKKIILLIILCGIMCNVKAQGADSLHAYEFADTFRAYSLFRFMKAAYSLPDDYINMSMDVASDKVHTLNPLELAVFLYIPNLKGTEENKDAKYETAKYIALHMSFMTTGKRCQSMTDLYIWMCNHLPKEEKLLLDTILKVYLDLSRDGRIDNIYEFRNK